MQAIRKVIIHAADTPADMDVGAEEIRRWHVDKNLRRLSDPSQHTPPTPRRFACAGGS